jgi:hypothetical protein
MIVFILVFQTTTMLKILCNQPCLKMGLLFLVTFIYSHATYSQSKEDMERLRELSLRNRAIYDSINKNDELRKNRAEYRDIESRSKSFVAFTMGYEISHADLNAFNADLGANGMTAVKSNFKALVFGYSRQNKRITGNLLFNIVITGNPTSNTNYSGRVAGGGVSFDKGYAFINTNKIIFHPFAGIGLQNHSIKVSEKNSTSGTVNSLFDIARGVKDGKITQNTFHAVAGAQFDYNLVFGKNSNAGLQLGIRFAYNPALVKGKYRDDRNDKSQYKPDITWRQYNISLLIKIFSRTVFHR